MISIDNGGTFTDVCVTGVDSVVHAKTLTTPYDLSECFVEVLKAASREILGEEQLLQLLAHSQYLRYSSTVGTNALIQKKGIRLGVLVDEGVGVDDLVRSDAERDLWSFLVDGRVCRLNLPESEADLEQEVVRGVNTLLGEGANRLVVALRGPDRVVVERRVKRVILRKYPRHMLGAIPVLFSHELTADPDHPRRMWTALLNSFLHPQVERFFWNAENILRQERYRKPLRIFHNDGNSGRVAKTVALKTYSSGPRGGLEGVRALALHYGWPLAISMDVGGTTTDVGVVRAGVIDTRPHGHVAGIETSFAMSEIASTGTGGSSVIRAEGGDLRIGPESVGAAPGPACFARGGKEATITDAYLLMGLLDGSAFLGGQVALDESRARRAVEENVARPLGISVEKAVLAMHAAFNQQLADAVALPDADKDAVLIAFGGAGPVAACAVARRAGIRNVVVPRMAAVFSAFGVSFSDIAHEYEALVELADAEDVRRRVNELRLAAERDMFAEGFSIEECATEQFVRVNANGSARTLRLDRDGRLEAVPVSSDGEAVVHLRVVKPILHPELRDPGATPAVEAVPTGFRDLLTGEGSVPVFAFDELAPGSTGSGRALIEDAYFTCQVEPGWTFLIDNNHNIVLHDVGGS